MPQNWNIVGYARSELSKEELVQRVTPFMGKPEEVDKEKLDKFFASCHYVVCVAKNSIKIEYRLANMIPWMILKN